jgi:hypothetical protein
MQAVTYAEPQLRLLAGVPSTHDQPYNGGFESSRSPPIQVSDAVSVSFTAEESKSAPVPARTVCEGRSR